MAESEGIGRGKRWEEATKVQCLIPFSLGWTEAEIEQLLGVPPRTQRRFQQVARQRGWTKEGQIVLGKHVPGGKSTGRLRKLESSNHQQVVDIITKNRNGSEKSTDVIAYEAGLSKSSAHPRAFHCWIS